MSSGRKIGVMLARNASLVLFCYVFAVFWWNLWMYHGLFGAFNLMGLIYQASGEGYYDQIFLSMLIFLLTCVYLGKLAFRYMIRWKG